MLTPTPDSLSPIDQMLHSSSTAMRLGLASVLGGVVGLEREWRHKASGLRTNMLISLGCAFFTILSAVLAGSYPDKGRVASNIVQGIGFLGAGLILHTRNRVLGLTSAASVFAVASIGMACGAGRFREAVLATGIVLISLQVIGLLEAKLGWKHYPMLYEVRGTDQGKIYRAVLSVLDRLNLRLNVVDKDSVAGLERLTFVLTTDRRRHMQLLAELKQSDQTDEVIAFRDEEEE
jgi:putative Mg2+ transporter-C (MgtC) family protein